MELQIYKSEIGFRDKLSNNKLTTNEIWSDINNVNWIYINDDILDWLEIDKKKFIKELKLNYKLEKHYKEYNNSEFTKLYICDNISCRNRTKHIIMNPRYFKMLSMGLETKKGNEIRSYYVDIQKKVFELMAK